MIEDCVEPRSRSISSSLERSCLGKRVLNGRNFIMKNDARRDGKAIVKFKLVWENEWTRWEDCEKKWIGKEEWNPTWTCLQKNTNKSAIRISDLFRSYFSRIISIKVKKNIRYIFEREVSLYCGFTNFTSDVWKSYL